MLLLRGETFGAVTMFCFLDSPEPKTRSLGSILTQLTQTKMAAQSHFITL